MMPLTHRERLQACLANDPALDRPLVALWRHFPVDDQSPETPLLRNRPFRAPHHTISHTGLVGGGN